MRQFPARRGIKQREASIEDQRARGGPAIGRLAPAICFLIAILEGYDIQAFGIAAQSLAGELHLDSAALGVAGSAAMAGLVIGAFGGGALTARLGPKPVLISSICLFALFSLATAMAHSFTMLVLARLVTGIGFGGAMPNLVAMATRLRPGGRHTGLATMIFCGMPAGGACTALVAHALGTPMPWRTLFIVGGIAPLLLAPAAMRWLPSFAPLPKGRDDKHLAATLFGQGRAVTTCLLWLSFVCTLLLLYLQLNWLPLLVVGKGFDPSVGVSATLAFNSAGVVISFLHGRWADKSGVRLPMLASSAFLMGGTAGMLLVGAQSHILIAAAMIGAGSTSLQYLLYAASPMPYPGAQSIPAAGAAIGIGRLGSIVGPLLAGVLRQAGFSVDTLLAMLLPVIALASLSGILAMSGTDRRRTTDEAAGPLQAES